MAEFDNVFVFSGAVLAQHQFFGPDHAAVLARQTDRATTMGIDQCNDLLIDQSAQHHFDNIYGFAVSYPQPFYKFGFLADALKQLLDLRATTVHHNGVHAHQFHQHYITGKATLEAFIRHGAAAVLNNDSAAMKVLNIWHGLGQYRRNGGWV